MARLLFITVLLIALPAPTAVATGIARPPLPSPMPRIVYAHCPGLPDTSCADSYAGAVYVDVSGRSLPARFVLYHELGHVFDDLRMDAGERNRFARLISAETTPWTWSYEDEAGRLIQGRMTLAERFADAYAYCRLGSEPETGRRWIQVTDHGYDPTPRRHRQACKLIARAGRDAGKRLAPDGHR